MEPDPFSPTDYQTRKLLSARDALVLATDTALLRMRQTFANITDEEYNWEPLSDVERLHDIALPADKKRVWRVFQTNGAYQYDYAGGVLQPPPFTTIAWIMNHIAQTAAMYLDCIKTGQAVGGGKSWGDLPVYSNLPDMRAYAFRALQEIKHYLLDLDPPLIDTELNKLTPTPWGELRPTYLNLWGGAIEHALQHTMQIATRKEQFRQPF